MVAEWCSFSLLIHCIKLSPASDYWRHTSNFFMICMDWLNLLPNSFLCNNNPRSIQSLNIVRLSQIHLEVEIPQGASSSQCHKPDIESQNNNVSDEEIKTLHLQQSMWCQNNNDGKKKKKFSTERAHMNAPSGQNNRSEGRLKTFLSKQHYVI